MSKFWILRDRIPVETSLLSWGEWFGDIDNRRVAWTEIGELVVSSVFLGLDHAFGRSGPPLLFETMIFAPAGHDLADWQARSATWSDAERNHAYACRLAAAAIRDPEAAREGRSPLRQMEERIMSALDDLKQQVAQTKSVEESAVALISGLAAKIRDAQDDPDELEDLAAQLETESASLSAAVTANTPTPPASTTTEPAPAGDAPTGDTDPAPEA